MSSSENEKPDRSVSVLTVYLCPHFNRYVGLHALKHKEEWEKLFVTSEENWCEHWDKLSTVLFEMSVDTFTSTFDYISNDCKHSNIGEPKTFKNTMVHKFKFRGDPDFEEIKSKLQKRTSTNKNYF